MTAEIIYDFTVEFCNRYLTNMSNKAYRSNRTYDQMVQAARSGKQNIAEGGQASGTSKKTELKLVNVARASLEELLIDYKDYLRVNGLALWQLNNRRVQALRQLAYAENRSYKTYESYLLANGESAANAAIVLINQANFLLDRQLKILEQDFLNNGGFTERLYRLRSSR